MNHKSWKYLIIILIITYILFIFIRPYEDDESLYMLSGKAMLQGKLNPFKISYQGHYSNPFQYIVGSPLAPTIYGLGYIIGGVYLSRVFAMTFILSSLIIVYKLTTKIKGNSTISLILAGFSVPAILLASDSFLDSVSLFLFILSLFLISKGMGLFSGISAGLAIISKFFLLIPVFFILIYLLIKKRNGWKFLFGTIIIILPFAILYNQLIGTIFNFLLKEKSNIIEADSLKNLFVSLIFSMPLASIICLLQLKNPVIKKYFILFIPIIVVISFHLLTTNFISIHRQLPYAEFPASILAGKILIKFNKKSIVLMSLGFIILNLFTASFSVSNYPSYNSIQNKLINLNGRILALNPHAFMLSKGLDIYATKDTVFSYYYFDYQYNSSTYNLKSDIEDYREALTDNYFDYATISSYSPPEFSRYGQIEDLVRKYYCPVLKQNKPNGIDIYKKCS